MPEEEMLIGISQLAITLVGFAGLVAVLSRPKDGVWNALARFRLRNLVEYGLSVTFVSLLPLILYGLGVPQEHLWRLACGLYFAVLLVITVTATRRFRQVQKSHSDDLSPRVAIIIYLLSLVATILVLLGVFNLWPALNAGLFITALYFNLGMPAVAFFIMVVTPGDAQQAD